MVALDLFPIEGLRGNDGGRHWRHMHSLVFV